MSAAGGRLAGRTLGCTGKLAAAPGLGLLQPGKGPGAGQGPRTGGNNVPTWNLELPSV